MTTDENTSTTVDLTTLVNDADKPASQLAYNILDVTGGTLAPTDNKGVYTFTPTPNFSGTASITYNAADGDSPDLTSDPATVTITVNPVNHAPTAGNGTAVTDEDTVTTIDLRPLASDVETSAADLTYNILDVSHGTLTPTTTNGVFTFSPAQDYNGTAIVTFSVTDTGDGSSPALTSGVATMAVTINPVNDAPVAQAQSLTVTEDGAVTFALAGTDVETPASALTFTIGSVPVDGVLLNASGGVVKAGDAFQVPPSLTYVPGVAADGARTVTFAFTVTDTGDGPSPALTSSPAAVTVNVVKAVADGTVTKQGGVVRIGGTSGDDNIVVTQSGGNLVVTYYGGDGKTILQQQTVASAGLTEIRAWGREGNDTIDLSGVNLRSFLSGGGGDDVLAGGGGDDLLLGQPGNDQLTGGAGNDLLVGGGGADRLVGASGNDVLISGSVVGTRTRDDLYRTLASWVAARPPDSSGAASGDPTGGTGTINTLTGGSGADLFFIRLGDRVTDLKAKNTEGDQVVYV